MKNLNQYIQEKYLIDLDTEDPLNSDKYYENREPDFVINNEQELLNLDSAIDNKFIKFITDCAKMPLLCWKIPCEKNNNFAGNILKFRKNNNIDISTCKTSIYTNDIGFMNILKDKNNNVVEIWLNRNKHDYMLLLLEKDKI